MATRLQLLSLIIMEEDKVHCPECNSTQITADKKGYHAGKAIAGVILTGGVGLLAGFHGSKKLVLYCMACGHKFKPGAKPKPPPPPSKAKDYTVAGYVFFTAFLLCAVAMVFAYYNCAFNRVPDSCLDDPAYIEKLAKERQDAIREMFKESQK